MFCPHCEKEVSMSTWYDHYNKFYDNSSKTWQDNSSLCKSNQEEMDFDFLNKTECPADRVDSDCQVEVFSTAYETDEPVESCNKDSFSDDKAFNVSNKYLACYSSR